MRMTKDLSARRAARMIVFALVVALGAPRAFAVNKDMVQLQTQVQELQTAVARLQQSNDERMGVLKDLVQQCADSVNKMSVAIDGLQQQMRTQHDSTNAKLDQFAGQLQSLNDTVDEVKTRLNNLEKSLQSVQDQQRSIDAALQNMAPPNPAAVPGAAIQTPDNSIGPTQPTGVSPIAPGGTPQTGNTVFPATQGPYANTAPAGAAPPATYATRPAPAAANTPVAPAASALYKTAISDYNGARYQLASSEFAEIIRVSPNDPLAGNCYYYLGELDYRSGKFSIAIKDYDRVLEQFPNNPKAPVSHLHKGMALFEIGKREPGITELRTLISRFPTSPEAVQARSKLNAMGVPIVPRRSAQ